MHTLDDRVGYAAGAGEALAPDGGFLIGALHGLELDAAGTAQGREFTESDGVIGVVRYGLVIGFGLLGDAGADEYGDAAGMQIFQISGDRAHRGNRGGHVVFKLLGEVLAQHVDESRAAGCGHLSAFFICLAPLGGLIGRCHIAAQTDFDHVLEAQLDAALTDGFHGDLLAELTLGSGGAHGVNFISGHDVVDDVYQIGLGSDRAERTGMDAVTAGDTLALIDLADAVIIIGDGADRAGLLTGTNQMGNRAVRAGVRAHTAFLTLGRIDVGTMGADGDGAETAGIQAGFTDTETAVVRNCIGRQRALFAGRTDDLDRICGSNFVPGRLGARQADPLLNDFSFFIDTAAILSDRSGNDLIDQRFFRLVIQLAFISKRSRSLHNFMLQAD